MTGNQLQLVARLRDAVGGAVGLFVFDRQIVIQRRRLGHRADHRAPASAVGDEHLGV